jgi:hypothetical protein
MFASTVILAGTVIVEGVRFRWSVTDGAAQHLTVSNDRLGNHAERLVGSPEQQARNIGRAILRGEIAQQR